MRILIAVFLITFWLFFPLGMQMLNSTNYEFLDQNDLDNSKNIKEGNILTSLSGIWEGLGIYFKFMFLTIPVVPVFIRMFVYVLQMLSALVIILIIRGSF